MRNTISELIKEVFSNIEGKYFGKGIAKLMNIPDFGSMSYFERYGWIEKNVGPKIGSGSVRTTFQIKEKPDLCIKILNFNSNIGRPINQKERYSFKMYPDLFPKVYAAEPSGDWIIVDKVRVASTANELGFLASRYFPVFAAYSAFFKKAGVSTIMINMKISSLLEEIFLTQHSIVSFNLDKQLQLINVIMMSNITKDLLKLAKRHYMLLEEAIKPYSEDPRMKKVLEAIKELKIDDLGPGNIGTDSSFTRFYIIDIGFDQ